ncbi:uncharacterized protein Dyak_GE27578 [Drosophila yakuba]|uniref:Uncharacterized protein n=1 Tax=Drosophila yakuba TaxID=7245 RepID=A0A0R1E810_DROYA|nr:uncharacterized protein Dyak_GE27578 [Drosophila yakuba]
MRGEQATGEGEQRGHHRGHRRLQRHHRGCPRSGTPVGSGARRFSAAQLLGWTGRPAVSLGGWLHHVRSASHGARLPMVRLHGAELPPLPEWRHGHLPAQRPT